MSKLVHKRARTTRELEAGGGRCYVVNRTVVVHMPECRPGRPLCRWMRTVQFGKYGVCCCDAYPFPHRHGSGRCGSGLPPWPIELDDYLRDLPVVDCDEEPPF